MSYRQRHRGAHPADESLFSEKHLPILQRACADLSWLLSRGYTKTAALKLVGDRYQLRVRQRMALQRAACSVGDRVHRRTHEVLEDQVRGAALAIDGYNLLITTESLLSGGVLIRAQDGCIRDLASLHGSYRRVAETATALEVIAKAFQSLCAMEATWYLDAPVSNSGRLAAFIRTFAEQQSLPWHIEVLPHVDQTLIACGKIVVTSDSAILDRVPRWFNFTAYLLGHVPFSPRLLDLSSMEE